MIYTLEHDTDRGTLSADTLQEIHCASPRAAADEMPFRGDSYNRAGVRCRVHCQPMAWLGHMGLFGTDVQSFRADMPAVLCNMVFYNDSRGGFE